jgi:hypothetical protein
MELEQNRKSKDYQNGKIYCIRSYQTELIYIGSTTQPLSKRLSLHKNNYKRWTIANIGYISAFEILKFDDAYIELIEDCPCNSKNELERREGQLIRETEKVVNKNIMGRSITEYYQDNKEQILLHQKEYYEAHKEQKKEYYQKNKELKKEYYQKNKLRILQYQHEYKKNKAKKD